jgi:hypothetical protein
MPSKRKERGDDLSISLFGHYFMPGLRLVDAGQ